MKKIIAIIVAVMMVLSGTVVAAAEETATLKVVSEAFTEEGQVKTVEIVAENVGGITALQLDLEYDETKLELVSVTTAETAPGTAKFMGIMVNSPIGYYIGNALQPSTGVTLKQPGNISIAWMNVMAQVIDADGVLVTLEFKAISDELGEATVGFAKAPSIADTSFMPKNDVVVDEDSEKVVIDYVHNHEWGEWEVTAEPGCATAGEKVRYCTSYNGTCDACETEAIAAPGHTEVIDAAVPATCTETGLTEGKHCSVCDEVIVAQKVVPALGHTEGEAVSENVVPATCGTDGSHDEVVYCAVCGVELSRENVVDAATGEHVYATEVERVEPTCTKEGYVVKACGCGETEKTAIAPLGHTEVVDAAVPATCTETGLTEGKHCSVCDEVIVAQEVVPALGHTEGEAVVENVVPATCSDDGSHDEVVYCAVCGVELSRENVVDAATGEHVYATEVERVEPTCTEEGYVVKACGCGETEKTVIAPLGHTHGEAVVENEKAPTCVAEGSYDEVVYCTVCGVEISRETKSVDALGHDHKYETVKEPTCTEKGERKTTCSRCDYEEISEIEALGHDWGAWKVVKNPTVKETGLSKRVCSHCDAEETKILNKLVYTGDISSSTAGVTEIKPGDKLVGESNPNTGAASAAGFAVVAAMGAIAVVFGKKNK